MPKADALELRRYYIERADEAKAKSRKRVMNEFSPMLAEKFVWKLNKEWLVRVPCFTLVVQRLLQVRVISHASPTHLPRISHASPVISLDLP